MASREALRAFQSRLASRLQEARTSGAAAAWLAVEAAGSKFLFPLNHAGEIFPWRAVQPVPHARPWFLGVANLRGGVSGVVDLGAFVTHAPPSLRSDIAQSQCRLVAFSDALNINCVVLIDKLLGLKGVESFVASVAPSAEAPEFFGHSYVDSQGAAWQEINLQALSVNSQFLSISA
jgi:twitching motility protein PilI